jgi:hypothetical protein
MILVVRETKEWLYGEEFVRLINVNINRRMATRVSVLAAWSEDCKCYSSLPLGAVVSLFY